MKAALIVALLLTGCSVKASHALMGAGLVTATSGAIAPDRDGPLRATTISVGLAVFAVGWILQQSDDPSGGPAPSQQIYSVVELPDASTAVATGENLHLYRRLPSDNAMFTP